MTGPIAKAVTSAVKAQTIADADGTDARFDEYWHYLVASWPPLSADHHMRARFADERVKGRAA